VRTDAPVDSGVAALAAILAQQQEEIAQMRKDHTHLVGTLEKKLDDMQAALLTAQTQTLQQQAKQQGTKYSISHMYIQGPL